MNTLLKSLIGLGSMSDQVIATDFLLAAKSGVQNYAVAITETTSPHVRSVLRGQLNDAIATHEAISNFMMKKGYYDPYNMPWQFMTDLKAADTALRLAGNN